MRLLCEFAAFNVVLVVAAIAAWDLGFVGIVVDSDHSRITWLMALVFVVTWIWQALVTVGAAKTFSDTASPVMKFEFPRHVFSTFAFCAQSLVVLGLIGTFVGFAIAVQGINQDAIGTAEKASDMIATLAFGLGIAIYTTITGAILGLWLDSNRRLILHRVEEFEWKQDRG